MRTLRVLILAALLLAGLSLLAEDIVHVKDGKQFRGKIVERNDKQIVLKTKYGDLTFPLEEIVSIERELTRIYVGEKEVYEGEASEEGGTVVLKTDFGTLRIPKKRVKKSEKFVRVQDAKGTRSRSMEMDRAERMRLHNRSLQLLRAKEYDEAIKVLKKIIEKSPEDETALYNAACAYALKGEGDTAVDFLKRAVEAGFVDFSHIQSDSDLDSIRGHPGYKALLAKRKEYEEKAAFKQLDRLKKRFGEGYTYEVDGERRLIFATNVSAAVLKRLKEVLIEYADAQWNFIFDNRPNSYITIVMPSAEDFRKMVGNRRIGGFYNPRGRILVAGSIGGVLTHEFTHALHFADMSARKQQHPIWIVEGLATCFESSRLEDGRAIPQHNGRLVLLKRALAAGKCIPLEKFFKLSHQQFMMNAGLCYSECRYVMYYLWRKKLLASFYRTYCKNYKDDKTGVKAIEEVSGKKIDEFEKEWKEWVAEQEFKMPRVAKGGPFMGIMSNPAAGGLQVMRLVPDSPASKAGLKEGDIIMKVDGEKVGSHEKLVGILRRHKPGDVLKLEVLRGEETKEMELTLGERKD